MGKGFINATIGAIFAGILGAVVWAAIAYFGNVEIGWIAWGIGALVGFAAAWGAGRNAGVQTGIMAAVVAAISVVGGKYVTLYFDVEDYLDQELSQPIVLEEHDMIVAEADLVVTEWEQEGRTIAWPQGMTIAEAYEEADYPADVWQEGKRRWSAVSEADKPALMDALKAQREANRELNRDQIAADIREGVFKDSFGMFDILFFGLAIFTAFGIGRGQGEQGEQQAAA